MEIDNRAFDDFLVRRASQYKVRVHVASAQEVIHDGSITFHEGQLHSTYTTDSVKRKMQDQRLNTQAYDPLLNLRNLSVHVEEGIWLLQCDWGDMFNVCNIGDSALLGIWVFFQWSNNDLKFLIRLDGRNVPLGARYPSIRELQNKASIYNKRMMITVSRANQLQDGWEAINYLIDTTNAQFLIRVRLNRAIIDMMLGYHNCFIIPNDLGDGNIQDFRTRLPPNVQDLTLATGGWSGRALDPWYRVMSIRVRDAVAHFELKLSWEEVLLFGRLTAGDTLSLWLIFQNHQPVIIIHHDRY